MAPESMLQQVILGMCALRRSIHGSNSHKIRPTRPCVASCRSCRQVALHSPPRTCSMCQPPS
eukprot:CAMPEP_0195063780 /NCGR_PEP_ID=MMETSP0448-20130528/10074_1 /TAXON_ID=66468 /ORGANISM="Heterocapsa triquestra, Strain CCMP 448" /LENGTH=61 /DNA_ID=CAMNT_0040094729 /DNA_START=641 /DNA_END=823 /DNA_ORIENTATION=+